MYLSYDTTETYIERQDYKISMLCTEEVFPSSEFKWERSKAKTFIHQRYKIRTVVSKLILVKFMPD